MPLEYGDEMWRHKTRIMELPCEEITNVVRTMWAQSTSVADRQTDRQTDG